MAPFNPTLESLRILPALSLSETSRRPSSMGQGRKSDGTLTFTSDETLLLKWAKESFRFRCAKEAFQRIWKQRYLPIAKKVPQNSLEPTKGSIGCLSKRALFTFRVIWDESKYGLGKSYWWVTSSMIPHRSSQRLIGVGVLVWGRMLAVHAHAS